MRAPHPTRLLAFYLAAALLAAPLAWIIGRWIGRAFPLP
jgi:hypothetical protein